MAFYPEFQQHPSKPHQCVWYNDEGVRCRSYAMRNQYTCYHHQTADMPEVMSNDPFPLPRADDFENIQMAVAEILERVAENRMDPKRASTLLNGLQIASSNLHRRKSILAAARIGQSPAPSHPEPEPIPFHPDPEQREEPAFAIASPTSHSASYPNVVEESAIPQPILEVRTQTPDGIERNLNHESEGDDHCGSN